MECIKTLEGHSNGVSCIAFVGDVLVSGSWDNTLKVTLIVLSVEPEASWLFGSKHKALIAYSCPDNVFTHSKFVKSHT